MRDERPQELGLHRQAGLFQAQKGVDNLAREEPAWQQDTLARAWAFLGQESAVSLTLWRNELGVGRQREPVSGCVRTHLADVCAQ